jgi:hypothetical protein
MSIRSIYEGITRWFLLDFVGKVTWHLKDGLTEKDKAELYKLLADDYYIILTRRRNHLSTYFTSLGNFLLTGKFGFWTHTLMNLEDEVDSKDDFRLIEAVSAGVQYSHFDDVFNVNAVALLKPKRVSLEQWTAAMDASKEFLGRRYDTLFDLANENKMSCVEVVRAALMRIPGYHALFTNFEARVSKKKNLTPQMYRDSDDFEVVYEVRR